MKYAITFVLGAVVALCVYVQYQGTINRTAADINHTSNQISAKVGEVKKLVTK